MATGGSAKSIKTTTPSGKPAHGPRSSPDAPPTGSGVPFRPLKPRPMLLVVLAAVFAAWVGFLVYLYFTTVPPRRAAPHVAEAAMPVKPSPIILLPVPLPE
jgi:hypothetical protein